MIIISFLLSFYRLAGAVQAEENPPSNFCPVIESTCPAADQALSLSDCYRLALQQSETIGIDKEKLAEAEAQFQQALSGILPKLDFISTDKRQDSNGAGSQFTLTYIPERKFSMSQPLFSGFKEFAAMGGAKAIRRQRTFERLRAEQLLFTNVSDAFYLLLEQRKDLDILKTIAQALDTRVQDLKHWVQIGRSRPSELSAAQAQREQVQADLDQADGQEVTARQLLEFLTGHPMGQIVDPLEQTPPLESTDHYLTKAPLRPDVQASEEAQRVAEKQVTYAKGDYWPNASLQGNYYTQRAGVLQGIDWDASLLLDLPIFSGGVTKGNVNQAKAQFREAELQKQLTLRSSLQDIHDAYAQVQTALNRTGSLEKAYHAADHSFVDQMEDYRRSRANNIDVLQSLQTLESVRRDFIRAQLESKRLFWRLKAATGETI